MMSVASAPQQPPRAADPVRSEKVQSWLPNFVSAPVLITLMISAELLAIVVLLAPVNGAGAFWLKIGPVSLFVQWIALCCALALNAAHRHLARLALLPSALGALLIVALVTFFCAFMAAQVQALLYPLDQSDVSFSFVWRMLLLTVLVTAAALRYIYVQHQWALQVQLNARTKVEALTARIRPHFLFNSMNTVASLITLDPARAEAVVENLSELFRAALRAGEKPITLRAELELAQQYLAIEQQRLGEKLQIQFEIDPQCLDYLLPPLLLQPLVENAVYHGIQRIQAGGLVLLQVRAERDCIRIVVENPSVEADALKSAGHAGNQLAHENIRERLQLAFGPKAALQLETMPRRYRATLVLPKSGVLSSGT
jgi:two-component system, LytTR family, sensor histidine kinase AlgZ